VPQPVERCHPVKSRHPDSREHATPPAQPDLQPIPHLSSLELCNNPRAVVRLSRVRATARRLAVPIHGLLCDGLRSQTEGRGDRNTVVLHSGRRTDGRCSGVLLGPYLGRVPLADTAERIDAASMPVLSRQSPLRCWGQVVGTAQGHGCKAMIFG
jgi:hypothetical protein